MTTTVKNSFESFFLAGELPHGVTVTLYLKDGRELVFPISEEKYEGVVVDEYETVAVFFSEKLGRASTVPFDSISYARLEIN